MPTDYKKYPPNWKSEIRPRILKRAMYCCEKCGLQNLQEVFSTKYEVSVPKGSRRKFITVWFSSEKDAIREQRKFEVKKVKVVLTISHLDHDETNWEVEDSRLMAMCQKCHLSYDLEEKIKRKSNK